MIVDAAFMYAGADPTYRDSVAPQLHRQGPKYHANGDVVRKMIARVTPPRLNSFASAGTALVISAVVATTGLRVHASDFQPPIPKRESCAPQVSKEIATSMASLERLVRDIQSMTPLQRTGEIDLLAKRIASREPAAMSSREIDVWAANLADSVAGAGD
jgi:hypothetical protein